MPYMRKRRDKMSIINEILEACNGGTIKTRIMYKVNLSFTRLRWYLSLLTKNGLLKEEERGGKKLYITTPKGYEFNRNYKYCISLIS